MRSLAVLIFVAATKLSIASAIESRIIGGENSNVGQFPSTVAIYVQTENSQFFCGGALYNSNWIITAGHCVHNALLFTIQLGSNTLEGDDPNRQTVATSEYIIHPDFNPDSIQNDIGLIKLRMPISYTQYIQPIYLPSEPLSISTEVVSVGWGQTSDYETNLSNTLQFVAATLLSNEECRVVYGGQIVDNMVCIEGNYNEGTCTGDNGSPLLQHYMYRMYLIVGVSSFISGNGCESNDPSGYTRVYPYAAWIRNLTSLDIE